MTQTGTANTEELAAAAEELSGQAEALRQMLGRFTLKSAGSFAGQTAIRAPKTRPRQGQGKAVAQAMLSFTQRA